MTTIIGAHLGDGSALICSDKAYTAGNEVLCVFHDSKIAETPWCLLGVSGSAAYMPFLMEAVKEVIPPTTPKTERGAVEAITLLFFEALPPRLLRQGDTQNLPDIQGELLVVTTNAIHCIDSCGGVHTLFSSFYAIGSGSQFALGALGALSICAARVSKAVVFDSIRVAAMHDVYTDLFREDPSCLTLQFVREEATDAPLPL